MKPYRCVPFLLAACLAAVALAGLSARPAVAQQFAVPPGKTVAVLPISYYYQVVQDYAKAEYEYESSLKGYYRESASASAHENAHVSAYGGMYAAGGNSGYSGSANSKASGDYDLKSKGRQSTTVTTDRTVVEKRLDTNVLTGIIESSLSEAGVRLADRASVSSALDPAKSSDPGYQQGLVLKPGKLKFADYVLVGELESYRIGSPRHVPDGTNRRYSVASTVRMSFKLVDTRSGACSFARTLTGKASKTFDQSDPVPASDVMELGVDDLGSKLVASLGGFVPEDRGDDTEYQDSPGKRLKSAQ